MGYHIKLDPRRCVGCGGCVTACIDQNDTDVLHGQPPRRRLETRERTVDGALRVDYLTLACTHCGRCIPACPEGCLRRDGETGFVVFREEDCVGCGACERVCPGGYVRLYRHKLTKCDGCYLRVKYGYEPACVRGCITGALTLRRDE